MLRSILGPPYLTNYHIMMWTGLYQYDTDTVDGGGHDSHRVSKVSTPYGSKYLIIIYLPKPVLQLLLPRAQVPNYWVLGPSGTRTN